MRKNIFFIFSIGILLTPVESFAWGHEGHQIIADIVKDHLSQNIQDSVKKYLGTMTFEQASTWMDDVRSDHSYDYMKSWHYIDIEKGQNYVPDPNDHNCITELQRVIKELDNKTKLSKDQINDDIKVLFHLVGDISQPLHCGYPEDKGGNTIHVSFLGKKVNLHRVWDSEIIYYKKINTEICEAAYSGINTAEIKKIQKIDVMSWVNDSRSLLPDVYDFQNNEIDENYIDKNTPIIEKQLFDSGLRLANVLTQIFSK